MDKVEGHLEVGTNDRGEVVVNLDKDRTGHVIFSPNQARTLAGILRKQAVIAEGGTEMPMDKDYLKLMAKAVEERLPDNYGFIVFAFPFGGGGRLFYTSNADRKDAVAALKEWLIRADGPEEWLKHLT